MSFGDDTLDPSNRYDRPVMTPTEYSEWRRKTALSYDAIGLPKLAFHTLGLTGEAGEVAEKVKKWFRDGTQNPDAICLELGDVLWYLTAVADDLGFTLQTVMERNVEKINRRDAIGTRRGSGDDR